MVDSQHRIGESSGVNRPSVNTSRILRTLLFATLFLIAPVTEVVGLTSTATASTAITASRTATQLVPQKIPTPKAAAAQTITFTKPADVALGVAPYNLVATASSKLPVSFASNSAAVCTVTPTGTVTIKTIGTCSITASQAGQAAKFKPATPVTQTFAVKTAQTITFTLSSSAITFGDSAPIITASSTAVGVTVSLTSSTPGVCTVSARTITVLTAGSCTIVAASAATPTVAAAVSVSRTFTIALRSQAITWVQDLTGVVAPEEGPITLVASTNSPLTVTFVASPASVCTVSGTDLTLVGPGNCSITARQAGDARYAAATPIAKTLRIRLAQAITFDPIEDQSLEDLLVSLEAFSDSGLTVSYLSSTKSVCVVRGGFIVLKSAGSCEVTARQAGNNLYGPAEEVVVSFEVTKIEQLITFEPPEDQTLDTTVVPLDVSSDSNLPVKLVSSDRSVCTTSGSSPIVTLRGEGTCEITASQAGGTKYAPAEDVVVTFEVAKVEQVITFDQIEEQTLEEPFLTLDAFSDSGLLVKFTSTDTTVCTVRGSVVTLRSEGTCEIVAKQAGNRVFAAAEDVPNAFTVSKIYQEITYEPIEDQRIDLGDVSLDVNTASGLFLIFGSNTPTICTITSSNPLVTLLRVGECEIAVNQPGNRRYAAAEEVLINFAVVGVEQVITFDQPEEQSLARPFVILAATSDSGLPVRFTSNSPEVCSVTEGGAVTLLSAGDCEIAANQAGTTIYDAAEEVVNTFTVNKIEQVITFDQPEEETLATTTLSLSAISDSGLPVTFTSNSPDVCTVTDVDEVTLVGAGDCEIAANQEGDDTYAAAEEVINTFAINKIDQVITFDQPDDQTLATASLPLTAVADSNLAISFTSNSPEICTVSLNGTVTLLRAGDCEIAANQEGNDTYAAAEEVINTFAINKIEQVITVAQPVDRFVGDPAFTLSASADSGLSLTYTSNSPEVCTVVATSGLVTLLASGDCEIGISQAGNGRYEAAEDESAIFSVNKIDQQISLTVAGSRVLQPVLSNVAGLTFELLGNESTTTPVFTVSDEDVCTIEDDLVLLHASGTCTITATVAEDDQYLEATSEISFDVIGVYDVSYVDESNPNAATVTIAQGSSVTLPTPTRAGYTFDGWFEDDSLVGMGGESYTPDHSVSLTAHWLALDFEITLSDAYNVSPLDSLLWSYDADLAGLPTVEEVNARRSVDSGEPDGYEFVGWYSDPAVHTEATLVENGDTNTAVGNRTLYAFWRLTTTTVTFDLNGATGTAPADATWTYGTFLTFPSAPTRAGYTFDGWFTADEGGEEITSLTANDSTDAETTLYAHGLTRQ
ncbi:hypothetical protein EBU60_00180 [bacterium]|nr:hypothetical protein [bacterium]